MVFRNMSIMLLFCKMPTRTARFELRDLDGIWKRVVIRAARAPARITLVGVCGGVYARSSFQGDLN